VRFGESDVLLAERGEGAGEVGVFDLEELAGILSRMGALGVFGISRY